MDARDIAQDWEKTPQQVSIALSGAGAPLLIDCREADEFAFCRIAGALLIPLSDFVRQSADLEIKETGAIVYCHHGVRSLTATKFLRDRGHQGVFSMAGGIDRWSAEIDPSIPVY